MKKVAALLLVIILGLFGVNALAVDQEIFDPSIEEIRYEQTRRCFANLSIGGDGSATCSGELQAFSSDTTSLLTTTLYKYDGGWKAIDSWSSSGKGRALVTAKGTKKVARGYKYKVTASGTIKDASGKVLERPSNSKTVEFQ